MVSRDGMERWYGEIVWRDGMERWRSHPAYQQLHKMRRRLLK